MAADEHGFDITLSRDKMTATLVIRPNARAAPRLDEVQAIASSRGVRLSPAFDAMVAEALAAWQPGRPLEAVVAEGTPAVDGINDGIDFNDDVPEDEHPLEASAEDGAVDFYRQGRFETIDPGYEIGRRIDRTDGEDGSDVTGRVVKARPGRKIPIVIDEETVEFHEDDGRLVARVPGMVAWDGKTLRVDRVLQVEADVDFNTGNLDFDGAIVIPGSVKDRFVVRATGNVTVSGLVEGATLLVGGDLLCARGMAAKERGQIVVDGDVQTGYFNNVRGRIGGNLSARRELLDCELVVGGDVRCDRSTIVGGSMVVTGRLEVDTLGSNAGVATRLFLGEVPMLTHAVNRLEAMRGELVANARSLEERIEQWKDTGRHIGDPDGMMGMEFELGECRNRMAAVDARRDTLIDLIGEHRHLDVTVFAKAYHRVTFVVRGVAYELRDPLDGPIKLTLDRGRVPMIQVRTANPQPLGAVANSTQLKAA